MIRYLAELAKRYDVRALRRFPPAKRYALTACFLVEVHKGPAGAFEQKPTVLRWAVVSG